MKKRVVDLTADELGKLAGEAWTAAAQRALARGLPVTGSRDGRRIRYYPDGNVEDLGPVAALKEKSKASTQGASAPAVDISDICEIAARLSEDAATLRSLGFINAAQFFELAEAEIANRADAAAPSAQASAPRGHSGGTWDINEIAEIAARLSEDAATLRHLGFDEAARFLELSEAEIDDRVYAPVRHGNAGDAKPARPRRLERGKPKEVPPH